MIKVALIGAGKMGISHLAILGAHPDVHIVGVCDTSKMVTDVLTKYSGFDCFSDYLQMVDKVKPDAVFIAVPTKVHARFIKDMLDRGIHVFSEKPFCLTPAEGEPLVKLAKEKNLVNQVGYHNKFIGTFREVKRIIETGALGDIHHFVAESYGPVVIRKKQETWRSDPAEGGGCLMDYASHVVDLLNYLLAPVQEVLASKLQPIFSNKVEDAVYAMLQLRDGTNGILSVNWSDETHRKMTTSVTFYGTRGKIISDANELKVYFNDSNCPDGYSKGWTVKYVTDLTDQVDFYLRGEEYSAQIDYFIDAIKGKVKNNINTFESAWTTDNSLNLIRQKAN
ncbi:MAG TPA: Gfo/Idh/MocA family oxidoreductase [Mucilaginibacter sp.]|jgi:predicted dehydrogenase|nr:Gfo/Idh/MocA family oxidoreductase [Mucilaginibacter sp.]